MKRRVWLWVVLGCGVAGVVLWLATREREPYYQGKSLTQWLKAELASPGASTAANAIRHIGTNALPLLLRRLRYEHPSPVLGDKLAVAIERLPGGRLPGGLLRGPAARACLRADAAELGFHLLGPQASPAIPELTRLMNDPAWPQSSSRAAHALAAIGGEALPPLLAAAADPNAPGHRNAVASVAFLGRPETNWLPAVAVLAQCLQERDLYIARTAARGLGRLALQPDLAVPALASSLTNTDWIVRIQAAQALQKFGEAARPAAPALLKLRDDTNPVVSKAATDALRKIAPDVLAREEVEKRNHSE